jgi:hypothetical protein
MYHDIRVEHKSYLKKNQIELVYVDELKADPELFAAQNIDLGYEEHFKNLLQEIGDGLAVIKIIRVPVGFNKEKIIEGLGDAVQEVKVIDDVD